MFYKSIEKITTTIYSPSMGFNLIHVVKVANKKNDGSRELFHTEYTYTSDTAYVNAKYLKGVRLRFSSYLLLEEVNSEKEWNIRESLYINNSNIHTLIRYIKKCRKWFYKKKHVDMYYTDEGELKINKEHVKDMSLQFKMYNKAVILQPAVLDRGGRDVEGIKLYLNNIGVVCEMDINQLDTFYYILKKFDLHLAGMSVINYVGRPSDESYNRDIKTGGRNIPNNTNAEEEAKFYNKYNYSKGMNTYFERQKQDIAKSQEFSNYFK